MVHGRKVEIYHVLPINDCAKHEESMTCSCNPRNITTPGASQLIIHNAYDGREVQEAKVQKSREVR